MVQNWHGVPLCIVYFWYLKLLEKWNTLSIPGVPIENQHIKGGGNSCDLLLSSQTVYCNNFYRLGGFSTEGAEGIDILDWGAMPPLENISAGQASRKCDTINIALKRTHAMQSDRFSLIKSMRSKLCSKQGHKYILPVEDGTEYTYEFFIHFRTR